MPEDLVTGWTEPIDQILKADGSAVNGTGMTITLELRDREGGLVDVTDKIAWLSASDGKARYSPGAEDLKSSRGPYYARWKVTDGSGKDVFFPNAAADVWTVRD